MCQSGNQLGKEQNKRMAVHIPLLLVVITKQKNKANKYYWLQQTTITELIKLM